MGEYELSYEAYAATTETFTEPGVDAAAEVVQLTMFYRALSRVAVVGLFAAPPDGSEGLSATTQALLRGAGMVRTFVNVRWPFGR